MSKRRTDCAPSREIGRVRWREGIDFNSKSALRVTSQEGRRGLTYCLGLGRGRFFDTNSKIKEACRAQRLGQMKLAFIPSYELDLFRNGEIVLK